MKSFRIFCLGLMALIATSCSKDKDDPAPSLENAKLSLMQNNQTLTAPSAMASSQNPQAQQAVGYIAFANVMTSYGTYFQPPSGATKLSSKITASNGRADADGDFVAYSWTDAQLQVSVGYQISEKSGSYVFEIFGKEAGSDWVKYVHAEEKKDRSSGFMKVYNIFDSTDLESLMEMSWTRNSDILKIDFSGLGFMFTMNFNEKTKAGDIVYYIEGDKIYEMSWTSAGNGTWKMYDEGVVIDQGTW